MSIERSLGEAELQEFESNYIRPAFEAWKVKFLRAANEFDQMVADAIPRPALHGWPQEPK